MSITVKKLNLQEKVTLYVKLFPSSDIPRHSSSCISLNVVLQEWNIWPGFVTQRNPFCFTSCSLDHSCWIKKKITKLRMFGTENKDLSLIKQQKRFVVKVGDEFCPVPRILWRTALRFPCFSCFFFFSTGTRVHSFVSVFPFVCGLLDSRQRYIWCWIGKSEGEIFCFLYFNWRKSYWSSRSSWCSMDKSSRKTASFFSLERGSSEQVHWGSRRVDLWPQLIGCRLAMSRGPSSCLILFLLLLLHLPQTWTCF